MKHYKKYAILLLIPAALLITSCGESPKVSKMPEKSGGNNMASMEMINVPLETASDGDISSLGATSISWPGEIVSYSDSQITPSRDGKIASIFVKIGDAVKKGQIVARLSPPESTLELTSLLADKKQYLMNAQAQATATKKLVEVAKKRLKEREAALIRSRDAALDVVEKEALQNASSVGGAGKELGALRISSEAKVSTAQAELAQAESLLSGRFNNARASMRTFIQRFSGSISSSGIAPETPDQTGRFSLLESYGGYDTNTRNEFTQKLGALLTALQNPSALPEEEAHHYLTAAFNLLSSTIQSPQVTVADLKKLRDMLIEDQQTWLDAMRDYQEAKIDVEVKKSKIERISSEADREVINAETNLEISKTTLDTVGSIKASQIALTDQEYIKEKTDLEVKIAELNRQQELAEAEVNAAAAAYSLVQAGTGGEIRAPENGIVSGISKKIGDYVTVDTVIASTSSNKTQNRFIRFRIPSDMKLPQKSEEITVERPGFPMTPEKATIVGIGLALDENGAYQADAQFINPVDWPVNASVRVISNTTSKLVLIPFTAVWWNETGGSFVWFVDEESMIFARAVKLGRALGDRIEVEEGLLKNDRYIPMSTPEIREGQMAMETKEQGGADPHAGHNM